MNIKQMVKTVGSLMKQSGLALAVFIFGLTQFVSSAHAAPPVSGYSRWFDASQITGMTNNQPVSTWNDLSGNGANATVPSGNAAPVYVANAGTESGLPALYFARNGGPANSAALRFTRASAIRTVFSVFKGRSFLLTDNNLYHFHRSSETSDADPIWSSLYTSANITNGSTYVNGALVNGTTFAMPTSLHNGFNLVEVLTTGNVQADSFNKDRTYSAGNQYQAEVIIYDRVLTETERLSVEAYLTAKWMPVTPEAKIKAFGPGATIDPVVANAAAISWTVPYGTSVTNLAPVFTTSYLATCDKVSGSVQDFTSPVHYIVISSDNLVTNDYTVTVTVAAVSSAKDILTFTFPNQPGVVISDTNITVTVAGGTDLTALSPTYTVSPWATGSPASGTALDFTGTQSYTITAQDLSTKIYAVTVTVAPDESTLIWNVAGGGAWDLASANWKGQSSGLVMPFFNGKNVIFDKTAGGTITIASGVLPSNTTVSATSGTYTFSGSLAGAGMLIKTNNGTLNLGSANTYTGGTLISAGTVACSLLDTSPLGGAGFVNVTVQSGATLVMNRNQITGSLTLNGGKIEAYNGWGDDRWTGPVALSGTSTIDVGATDGALAFNGVVSGTGTLIKRGTSSRAMSLNATNTFSGTTILNQGTIQIGASGQLASLQVVVNAGKLKLSNSSSLTATTTLTIADGGAQIDIPAGVTQTVTALYLGSDGKPEFLGTWGHSTSDATNKDDVHFTATSGKLRVLTGMQRGMIISFY